RGRLPPPRDRPAQWDRGGNFEGPVVSGTAPVAGGVEQMMCNEWETQLNEYVDGTLAAEARALVEAHLAGCAGCRAAVVELRALVASAADLPKRIEPARDLWTGIAARVGKREVRNGKRWWRTALAAAATIVIGFALYRLLPPSAVHHRSEGTGWVAVQAQYEHARD